MKRSIYTLGFLFLAFGGWLGATGCNKTDRGVSCIPAINEAECRVCCDGMGLEFAEWFQIEIDRGECFCKEEGE